LGYQALGNAALLKVTDPPVLERLAKEGYAPSVTVTLAERLPLLEIEAVGSSEAQATATVREIIKLLADDILTEQKQYGVATEDTITTLTLNDGANVEVVTSKVKRAIVVAGGVGMLVTVGGTIGLDALLRRRSRRRLGMDAADLSSPPPAPAEPEARRRQVGEDAAPARTPRLLSGLTLPSTAGRGRAQSSGAVEPKMPQAPPQPAAKPPKPPVSRPIRTPSGEVSLTMEYRQSAEPTSVLPDPSAEDDAGTTALPVDATIVLPLPHATHWPRRDGRTNGR
ncbi:MAG TPA: hypothetical protein VFE14_11385, partial [Micromonosporaceae bacterium]|nr:hypothetical protein [Micromonosporaceae bacterium]